METVNTCHTTCWQWWISSVWNAKKAQHLLWFSQNTCHDAHHLMAKCVFICSTTTKSNPQAQHHSMVHLSHNPIDYSSPVAIFPSLSVPLLPFVAPLAPLSPDLTTVMTSKTVVLCDFFCKELHISYPCYIPPRICRLRHKLPAILRQTAAMVCWKNLVHHASLSEDSGR